MNEVQITLIPRKPGDSTYYQNVLLQDKDGWVIGCCHIDSFYDEDLVSDDGKWRGGEVYRRLTTGHRLSGRLSIVGGALPPEGD